MKFPKNRETVFYVSREDSVVVGVFANYEDAEDYSGGCEQEFLDKTGYTVRFYVHATTFYG